MPLPVPIEITLPSFSDQTALSCRIYRSGSQGPILKAAVVAHPYAPLGGDYNDAVVLLVAEELYNAGFVVMTFNFRGANSYRRAATSWTGKPEMADYTTVTYFLVHFISALNGAATGKMRIVLGGYSYGSMIACSIPPVSELVEELETTSAHLTVRESASKLAKEVLNEPQPTVSEITKAGLPLIETHYLLVSPLLPPVSSFLTMFSASKRDEHLQVNKTLAIFGSNDHFTSSSKLLAWAEKIGIHGEEVNGADHFWHDINTVQTLRQAIRSWAAGSS